MIIKIIKFTLRILSQVLIKFKLLKLAKIFSSIRASILLKKSVNVYFDGEDWIYKWNKSTSSNGYDEALDITIDSLNNIYITNIPPNCIIGSIIHIIA